MPNYDPTMLAQMLRQKSGSAATPAEAQAIAQQRAQQIYQMQQQQDIERMRQQAGAAVSPTEMLYYQQMQGR